MEQKKSISIFSAVALFLYISAIIFFCISLISEYKTAEQLVETRFKKLAKNTQETYKTETKNTATFTNAMLQIINSTSDIASVYVMEGSDTIFEWPQGNTAENTSPLIKSYSTEIAQDLNGSVIITASLYVLKPESIYKTAKISFIVVLAATLCTVVFFVYINITGAMPDKPFIDFSHFKVNREKKAKKEVQTPLEEKLEEKEDEDFKSVTFSRITMSHEEPKPSQEDYRADKTTIEPVPLVQESVQESEQAQKQEEDTPYTLTSETYSGLTMTQDIPYTLTQETMSESVPELQPQMTAVPSADDTMTQFQSSKYSPFTGFCWESFIDSEVNAEIEGSITEGKDVSLLFMQIIGLDRMDYASEDIRSVLYNAIGNRDLLFEYKNDGYTILLPQTDINGGIKIAELIEPKITEILKSQGKTAQIMIGISARTERNINAAVLRDEAEKALSHAEPSLPIIAFRVDPAKYNEFINNKQPTAAL